MLRFVGPWAKTTRSSASSDRASLLSNVTQTRVNGSHASRRATS